MRRAFNYVAFTWTTRYLWCQQRMAKLLVPCVLSDAGEWQIWKSISWGLLIKSPSTGGNSSSSYSAEETSLVVSFGGDAHLEPSCNLICIARHVILKLSSHFMRFAFWNVGQSQPTFPQIYWQPNRTVGAVAENVSWYYHTHGNLTCSNRQTHTKFCVALCMSRPHCVELIRGVSISISALYITQTVIPISHKFIFAYSAKKFNRNGFHWFCHDLRAGETKSELVCGRRGHATHSLDWNHSLPSVSIRLNRCCVHPTSAIKRTGNCLPESNEPSEIAHHYMSLENCRIPKV